MSHLLALTLNVSSILPLDRTLSGVPTQSGVEIDGNEGVLRIL